MELLWICIIGITIVIYIKTKYNLIAKPFFYAWLFLVAMSASVYLLMVNITISTKPTDSDINSMLTQINNQYVIDLNIGTIKQDKNRYIVDVTYFLNNKSCESKLYIIREKDRYISSEREKRCVDIKKI
jgi:hypothetical protein